LLCAYASWLDKYLYFDEKNIGDLIKAIADADVVNGFNIFGFDVPLLKATLTRLGKPEKTGMSGKCYDILADIRKTLGGAYPKGWTLDNIMQATFGIGKSHDGAEAPRMWQREEIAELYNYVTIDVFLEHKLFLHILDGKPIKNGDSGPITLEGIQKWRDFQEAE